MAGGVPPSGAYYAAQPLPQSQQSGGAGSGWGGGAEDRGTYPPLQPAPRPVPGEERLPQYQNPYQAYYPPPQPPGYPPPQPQPQQSIGGPPPVPATAHHHGLGLGGAALLGAGVGIAGGVLMEEHEKHELKEKLEQEEERERREIQDMQYLEREEERKGLEGYQNNAEDYALREEMRNDEYIDEYGYEDGGEIRDDIY